MTLNRRPVASLWIGDSLHYINQLCLQSHLDMGHPVTLYCTDQVRNVPKGVEVRPATEIMEIDRSIVAETSASFLSNVFRYKMIAKTGAIWVDCDAYCHRPFPEEQTHIYAGHGMRGALNCGVVAIPQTGRLMDALLGYYDNLPNYPAWWGNKQKKKMDKLPSSVPLAVRIYQTERTAFGPQAFTWFAQATGEIDKAMPPETLYPVPFQLNDVFYDPHCNVEGHFTDRTLSVHIYTNGTRPWWRKNPPLAGSYMDRMCKKHGIDPSAALEE